MAPIRRPAATTAVQSPPAAVASMNPDNMIAGGLADDFDGLVTKARFVPWDYDGKIDHHVLAVALTVLIDGEKEPFTQHYSAGELEQFAPSMDGTNPVPLDNENATEAQLEGVYALRVGKKEQLNNNTNWAQFVGALIDAQFDKSQLGSSVTFMEGVYGHWNRIPQKKRSGIVATPAAGAGAAKARANDILVITELKQAPTGAKTAARPAKATAAAQAQQAAPATASSGGGDLDDRLAVVVTEAVLAAGDEGLLKGKLAGIVIKAFAGPEKAKAVKRVSETEFLEGYDTWVFDADSGLLIGVAAE